MCVKLRQLKNGYDRDGSCQQESKNFLEDFSFLCRILNIWGDFVRFGRMEPDTRISDDRKKNVRRSMFRLAERRCKYGKIFGRTD